MRFRVSTSPARRQFATNERIELAIQRAWNVPFEMGRVTVPDRLDGRVATHFLVRHPDDAEVLIFDARQLRHDLVHVAERNAKDFQTRINQFMAQEVEQSGDKAWTPDRLGQVMAARMGLSDGYNSMIRHFLEELGDEWFDKHTMTPPKRRLLVDCMLEHLATICFDSHTKCSFGTWFSQSCPDPIEEPHEVVHTTITDIGDRQLQRMFNVWFFTNSAADPDIAYVTGMWQAFPNHFYRAVPGQKPRSIFDLPSPSNLTYVVPPVMEPITLDEAVARAPDSMGVMAMPIDGEPDTTRAVRTGRHEPGAEMGGLVPLDEDQIPMVLLNDEKIRAQMAGIVTAHSIGSMMTADQLTDPLAVMHRLYEVPNVHPLDASLYHILRMCRGVAATPSTSERENVFNDCAVDHIMDTLAYGEPGQVRKNIPHETKLWDAAKKAVAWCGLLQARTTPEQFLAALRDCVRFRTLGEVVAMRAEAAEEAKKNAEFRAEMREMKETVDAVAQHVSLPSKRPFSTISARGDDPCAPEADAGAQGEEGDLSPCAKRARRAELDAQIEVLQRKRDVEIERLRKQRDALEQKAEKPSNKRVAFDPPSKRQRIVLGETVEFDPQQMGDWVLPNHILRQLFADHPDPAWRSARKRAFMFKEHGVRSKRSAKETLWCGLRPLT